MAIKFGKLIVSGKEVGSQEPPQPEPVVVRAVAPSIPTEQANVGDKKKSRYMMDMSTPIPPAYFDEE